jgi:YbgC/YbaW family acyl-CoA thioester hydrolase
VHFANYIRMMEETEYAFLRSRDLSVVMNDRRGVIGFPRVSSEVQIQTPARFDDELEIGLEVVGNDGVVIDYRFEIIRAADALASGRFRVACCRFPPGQPPRAILIPDFFQDRFHAASR